MSARRCSGAARRRQRSSQRWVGAIRQSSDAASARRSRSSSGRTRSGSRSGRADALAALARAGDVVSGARTPWTRTAAPTTSTRCITRRRRRPEHQRARRGGDRRSAGVHDPAAGVSRQPGGHVPLPLPADSRRRVSERRRARSTSTSRSSPVCCRAARCGTNRPFVEHFIRPRGAAVAATPVFVDAVEDDRARVVSAAAAFAPAWLLLLRPADVRSGAGRPRCHSLERIYWNPQASW